MRSGVARSSRRRCCSSGWCGAAVVGGEEEGEAGDFFGLQFSFEGLAGEHLGGVGFVEPESFLALGKDAPRKDGVDADVVGAELVGEGAGEADDGGLGCDVDGQVGGGDEPGDGAHIDDRTALTLAHARDDGLSKEELVFEVDGEERVPEFGSDVLGVVAGVVGGVVDEDVDGRECSEEGLEGGGVGEVAVVVGGGVGWRRVMRVWAAASWMSRKRTREPCWAKASTRDAPMPVAPPVMRTVRSRRLG